MTKKPISTVGDEIHQSRAFATIEEELLVSLLRTTDVLHERFEQMIRPFNISMTQYNVLRILRGAQPQGLTCSAIGDRMITAEPDITRLLSRLKTLKLIRQQRDRHDRRVVWTQISDAGLKLLQEMDPVIQKLPIDLMGHLDKTELAEFIRLLELARAGADVPEQPAPQEPVTCDGTRCNEAVERPA